MTYPHRTTLATALMLGSLCATPAALAQATTAGTAPTHVAPDAPSSTSPAGASVKRAWLGKPVYANDGQVLGKVNDLIVASDGVVTGVILGVEGVVGRARHEVSIPMTQVEARAGKWIAAGATPATVKAMPAYRDASDSVRRDQFVAAADRDIARGNARLDELEQQAGYSASDAKARIDAQRMALQIDVKVAQAKLDEMKHAVVARWHEFEAEVDAATARLRKSIETATG